MIFTDVLRVCLEFAVDNNASLQSYSENVQKVGIHARGERKEAYVERSKSDRWDIFSMVNGKTTTLPPVSSKDELLNRLKGIWTTPMQATASLMDAKLADVHKAIEKNTELLEKIVNSLHNLLKREETT